MTTCNPRVPVILDRVRPTTGTSPRTDEGGPATPQRYCCCRALPTELRRRTTELVGPPTNLADRAPIGFTAVMDGSCALTVSLNDACALDDVYELCEQIVDACLHDDTDVSFTRDRPASGNS